MRIPCEKRVSRHTTTPSRRGHLLEVFLRLPCQVLLGVVSLPLDVEFQGSLSSPSAASMLKLGKTSLTSPSMMCFLIASTTYLMRVSIAQVQCQHTTHSSSSRSSSSSPSPSWSSKSSPLASTSSLGSEAAPAEADFRVARGGVEKPPASEESSSLRAARGLAIVPKRLC